MAAAVLACIFVGAGVWQLGGGLIIAAKAKVAQILLEDAWAETLETHAPRKPWPWADTWPVAKLTVPRLQESAIVLDKVSGQALAFGPGLMPNFAAIGAPGTAVIAAHRDTHFAFLKSLETGDIIEAETAGGALVRFRVTGAEVVDARHPLALLQGETPRLLLSTCYPFDTIASRTPFRFLVSAEKIEN